jgi:hypothetical protein
VVEGFCTAGAPSASWPILVSPRNEPKGRRLEARFPQVRRPASATSPRRPPPRAA